LRRPPSQFASISVIVTFVAVALFTAFPMVASGSQSRNDVASRLLNTSDLPAGWKAVATQSSTLNFSKTKCLSGLARSHADVTSVSTSFTERVGLPALAETLSKGQAISSDYAKGTRKLATCHSLTFTQDKKSIRATISPISLTPVGSGSASYSLNFKVEDFPFVVDIVLFHTTKYLGELVYSNSVPTPAKIIEAITAEAVKKAEGKTVTAPAVSIVSAPVQIAKTRMGAVGFRTFGSGPPLVMIMGYGGTMESWDPRFVDALSANYKVVVFDNAGVGDTRALSTPLTIDAMADQTSALITTLGLKKPDVLGWSMGGMIAQALAVLHPSQVGRLVLCATFPGTGSVKPSQAAINDLKSADPATVMSVLFPSNRSAATEAFEIAIGDYPSSSAPSSVVVAAQTYAVDEWFDGRDHAGGKTAGITAPTLIADGTDDRLDAVANDRRLATLIPKAQLTLYPDAGHAFIFQDQNAFVPVVNAFLSAK
jgi:pimeloyl-ACP methyl ester carboxylesterase